MADGRWNDMVSLVTPCRDWVAGQESFVVSTQLKAHHQSPSSTAAPSHCKQYKSPRSSRAIPPVPRNPQRHLNPTWPPLTRKALPPPSTRRPSPQSARPSSAATPWRSTCSTGPRRRTSRTGTFCSTPRLLRMQCPPASHARELLCGVDRDARS